jgi:hypothetical protein
MKRKHLTETPVCPRERLVIISYTTGLSFALERIGPLAAIIITVFYFLVLYLFVLPNTPENLFASIYSESMIKTACQHLLLLVGFDTLIYRKYYYTPPILVGHQHGGESYPRRSEVEGDIPIPMERGECSKSRMEGVHHLQSVSFVEQLSCDD